MIADQVTSIYIKTGNVISCKEFNRKATQSPTEEVFESVNCTLHSWLKTHSEDVEDMKILQCINRDQSLAIDKEDRINLKLTVKVFLERFNCDDLKASVAEALTSLNVNLIDSIILALPESPPNQSVLESIKPLWRVLESLVQEEKVVTIGISDLDTSQLAELYNWAQVKPSVNQVNLESCCVMPPEMTSFAKENDIQLLTHNDPKVILPQDLVSKMIHPITAAVDAWKTRWILRYSVVVKCRGIIQSKGYILYLEKDRICNGPC